MSIGDFVYPALSIGLGSINIRPKRGFFPSSTAALGPNKPVIPYAVLEEVHRDDLEITEQPVEFGAPVSDHSFKRPAEVMIRAGWSNSPQVKGGLIGAAVAAAESAVPILGKVIAGAQTIVAANNTVQSVLSGSGPGQVKAIYAMLLELQASRIPFDIYTGKRVYKNMLFKSLATTTDASTENSLIIVANCKQVIIVNTQTVDVPINTNAQATPEKTTPVTNSGIKQLAPSSVPAATLGAQ